MVGGLLVAEVHAANAALDATAEQTLRDYADYAARVLGTELLRQSQSFRARLYSAVVGATVRTGRALSVQEFARRADSLYLDDRYGPDSLRGYIRVDMSSGRWDAAGPMRASERVRPVVDTLLGTWRGAHDLMQPGVLIVPMGDREIMALYAPAADTVAHKVYVYVATQTRSLNLSHAMAATMAAVPLLPPSFTGPDSVASRAAGFSARESNDSLIGVRVVASDGALLYSSPRWFAGPYRGSYQFQVGRGGFAIQTVLRPGLELALVPRAVRVAGRSLYVAVAMFGAFLLAVSLIAFWGEVKQREGERDRAIRDLATGLRHELNNALASILLEAELLATAVETPDDACVTGATIAEQATRMRDVLRRLDHADRLPVVSYRDDKSMIDVAHGIQRPLHDAIT